MAQAIAETVFDVFYLSFALIVGLMMMLRGTTPLVKKAGWMVTLLGAGDAFHLVPRIYGLWTIGLEANAAALGVGKFITSITMTIFYLLLYYIWRERYQITGQKNLTNTMWVLSALRIGLCLFPQNEWLVYKQPLLFGILRNLPFTVMGVLIIVIFAQQVKQTGDKVFRFLPLAVTLSFGFYLPVVLWGNTVPMVGMLMIPKTLAYVWVALMCWQLYRHPQKAALTKKETM